MATPWYLITCPSTGNQLRKSQCKEHVTAGDHWRRSAHVIGTRQHWERSIAFVREDQRHNEITFTLTRYFCGHFSQGSLGYGRGQYLSCTREPDCTPLKHRLWKHLYTEHKDSLIIPFTKLDVVFQFVKIWPSRVHSHHIFFLRCSELKKHNIMCYCSLYVKGWWTYPIQLDSDFTFHRN